MLILLFVLLVAMVIWELNLEKKNKNTIISEIIGVTAGIVLIFLTAEIVTISWTYSQSFIIDDRIEMYQAQNTKIERDISDIVESYKDYESSTFIKCRSNPTLALSMYPELKSNTLVSKEIDVYVKNNNKIKSLQDKKIRYSLYAWWLYFGH